ncbi:hypothetical protein DSCO28_50810 [Desulfosarcina ovata subsp. sediminis]|uniref:Uncharacterized protein n=1 Tax=Desulfosarcina ovata subsp. sediminis TaxID=885957 RepID=A0A5K7ZW77_9BACT|nr:hypothetical protein [Desulfosarcina ovata]BBO84515.1 hypothetical protein DSCO28_50810 [Desulfosarcina ovata subsp. sediminis]
MSKKRRHIAIDNPKQQSLLDYIRSLDDAKRSYAGTEGSMNIRDRLRLAPNRAIKNCRLSRPQIAGEMSHLLGADVTKSVMDSWTAESKDNYRIPAEYLPAFCRVVGSNEPIDILTESAGMFALPGPDALRSEIQRWSEKASNAQAEVKKRKRLLREMEERR